MSHEELLQNGEGKNALYKTLVWLGKRSYTEKQIREKLLQKGYTAVVINLVIDYCSNMGYLNDEDYIKQWLATYSALKPMGRKRIFYELKKRGIEPDLIITILNESFSHEEEYQLAAGLIQKKIGNNFEMDKKAVKKFYQLLLRRGFSHDIAMDILNNLDNLG